MGQRLGVHSSGGHGGRLSSFWGATLAKKQTDNTRNRRRLGETTSPQERAAQASAGRAISL